MQHAKIRPHRFIAWLSVLLLLLLTACSPQANDSPALELTNDMAIDILWNYEQALLYKLSDPSQYVTDAEQKWLERLLVERSTGQKSPLTWKVNGAVVKVEKFTAKEALVITQFETSAGLQTIRFQFRPVAGQWKIANHQTPNGQWWTPDTK